MPRRIFKPGGFLYGSPSAAGDEDSPVRSLSTLQYIPTGVSGALPNDVLDSPMGYPVVIADGVPDVGTVAYPIAFSDFRRGYQIIETPTIALADPYTTKGYVKFYTARRVGGKVCNSEAIKLIKCSAS